MTYGQSSIMTDYYTTKTEAHWHRENNELCYYTKLLINSENTGILVHDHHHSTIDLKMGTL